MITQEEELLKQLKEISEESYNKMASCFLDFVNSFKQDRLEILDDQWAVSGPRNNGFDIVVFDVPATTTSLEYSINNGIWLPLGGSTAGVYSIDNLPSPDGYRVSLRANNSLTGLKSDDFGQTIPQDPRNFRGWNAQLDLGSSGNYFVAPYGDDSNSGTIASPFATINAAYSAASDGDVIKVRAGRYREKLLSTKEITIEGYETEKPVITGSNFTPPMTQVDASDAPVIGTTFGVAGSPVFKTTLTNVPWTNLNALNIHVAGKQYYPASDRADTSDLFNFFDETTYYVADNFVLNNSNQIVGITDASVINSSRYTASELLNASILIYHNPNQSSLVNVTGVNLATNTITIDGLKTYQSSLNGFENSYSIEGVARGLNPGTFFAVQNGSDVDLYVHLENSYNADMVEYSIRDYNIRMNAGSSNQTFRGVHLENPAGEITGQGSALSLIQISADTENVVFENNLIRGTNNIGARGPAIRLQRTIDSVIRNVTIYEVNAEGILLGGGSLVEGTLNTPFGERNLIELCHVERTGSSWCNPWTQKDTVIAHTWVKQIGTKTHANKSAAYQQNDGVVFWGIEYDVDCFGYKTLQESSSMTIAFCHAPVASKSNIDSRGFVDQQRIDITPPPVLGTTVHTFNNLFAPDFGNTGSGAAMVLGNNNSDLIHVSENNITHGITSQAQVAAQPSTVDHNIITRLVFDGASQNASTFAGTNNVVELNLNNVFVDANNDNFEPSVGSPILTALTVDKTSVINAMSTRTPQFTNYDKDYKYQVINWSRPPMGPDSSLAFI